MSTRCREHATRCDGLQQHVSNPVTSVQDEAHRTHAFWSQNVPKELRRWPGAPPGKVASSKPWRVGLLTRPHTCQLMGIVQHSLANCRFTASASACSLATSGLVWASSRSWSITGSLSRPKLMASWPGGSAWDECHQKYWLSS